MGKGSKRRPTDEKRYGENWDRIFGPKHAPDSKEVEHAPDSEDEDEKEM